MKKLAVGSYTGVANIFGFQIYEIGLEDFNANSIQKIDIANPSFFCIPNASTYCYVVNENHTNDDSISALKFTSSGLAVIDQASSGGSDPCYISVNATNSHLFSANYSSGTLSARSLNDDGSFSDFIQIIKHEIPAGDNFHKNSYMHAAILSPDEKFLLAVNLGLDTITMYHYDCTRKEMPLAIESFSQYSFPDGTGPRHAIFSENGQYLLVVGELDGTLHVLSFEGGKLKNVQKENLMDLTYNGQNSAADIHFSEDGRFLYISNRGDANCIVIFSFSQITGEIKFVDRVESIGKGPRNFAIDKSGNFMAVAHQYSNDVNLFKIDKASGGLSYLSRIIQTASPVFVKFL
ncbi:6-phosphogluconolactonase [Pedobacter sp. UYP24]